MLLPTTPHRRSRPVQRSESESKYHHEANAQATQSVRANQSVYTVQQIAHYLRRPVAECAKQLSANQKFIREIEQRRTTQQSRHQLRRQLAKWQGLDLTNYLNLNASDPRSRIIATYHFGDFVFAMNYLLRHDPADRACIVLTQKTSAAPYFDNMQRVFADQATAASQQWPLDEVTPSRLSSRLRTGKVSLVTFCDLPSGFGATAQVNFLGRQASFPRGAASLALRYRIPILPVISCYRGGKHQLVIGRQIEPGAEQDERLGECITRITQELTDFLQSFVRVYPWQWRFLRSLPGYFNSSSSASGRAR